MHAFGYTGILCSAAVYALHLANTMYEQLAVHHAVSLHVVGCGRTSVPSGRFRIFRAQGGRVRGPKGRRPGRRMVPARRACDA